MRRMSTWRIAATLFVAAALSASCDLMGPSADSPLAPEVEASELLLGWGDRDEDDQSAPVIVAESELTFIEENVPEHAALSDVQLLGLLGGVLNAGGHVVRVPLGAVTSLTRFSMERVPGDRAVLELHATRGILGWLGSTVVKLFRVPVTLEMSYANATNLPADVSTLKIVRFRDDGTFQVMPTEIDPVRKVITTQLEHFSLYAMASN